ncbi:MAG TPA: 16S rRNA (cytosine(1402)-N(4))-methyltransferase RsmH [Phototrophicaceae bacterium]|jgi:16S rRNA (cytosine1402-N4)-methyltransferase|nr:16S rRNA (cytosine(1402)-N(4))-methyltransferase RsmH [Phototrophicaceae bacterium]
MSHLPVLLDEVLAALTPEGRSIERIIDGTLGAGGHTRALLDAGVAQVLGFDLDLQALEIAQAGLAAYGERAIIIHSSYADMRQQAQHQGWSDGVDGILLDLGVSSMQLDTAERGFAFMKDGPLDMRFDPTGIQASAADLLNHVGADELADMLYEYGEERESRRLARIIINGRPYQTTRQLAEVIEQAMPRRPGVKAAHPATRVFQALRIAVNDELKIIETVLPEAIDLLRPGGRLAVISFHSLEDRIVKQTFKEAATEIISPPGMVLEEKQAIVRLITRKPVEATENEIVRNARSRSAKLRVVEKI